MVADRNAVATEFSRDLTLFHVTMMGLGMMIGAGIFIGIGLTLHGAGPGGLLLTFALNGLIALFTAMSFAELSSAMPRAGGAYNFARVGFGRGTSFLAGWMEWFASSVAGSLYAVVFATYILEFLAHIGWLDWLPIPRGVATRIVALGVAAFFVYVNYRGASETGKVGAFFTLGQMLFVCSIAAVGLFVLIRDPSRLQNFRDFMPHGWWKMLGTMGAIYVAFEGFEVIAQAGDETIDPKRNIPKAMLYSVFIVTITYVFVAFAAVVGVKAGAPYLHGMEPWQWIGQFKDTGFGQAVKVLMPFGGLLVTLAVIFSATSALNATIYSATRCSYALGRDGMLPRVFGRISQKRKTPHVALMATGGLLVAGATCLPTLHVAASASIMFLFLFFLVNICVIRIRRNMGDELRYGYLMPLFPLFPILAIVCQAALAGGIMNESKVAWVIAPVWILAGALVYVLYGRRHAVAGDHEVHVFEEKKAPEGGQFRIMVAVANPHNALELVRNTHKLCGAKDARVELLHMVPVPDQVPLSDAAPYLLSGREGIVEAMLYLIPHFPLSTTLRYCRNPARGIVSAVREKKTDMLIMGWHGRSDTRVFSLGSTIDPVIELAPCDVVVLKGCRKPDFKRVLVPLAGGPNGALALEIASILADDEEGEIVPFAVVGQAPALDLDAFVEQHQDRLHLPRERVKTRTARGPGVANAILQEAEAHDLVVLGYTREPLLAQMRRSPIPETVATRCPKPVVVVKASAGIRSWIQRWV